MDARSFSHRPKPLLQATVRKTRSNQSAHHRRRQQDGADGQQPPMKLCNFASLDPVQTARGIRGLPGATPLDREMWNEFREHVNTLGPESEQILHDLYTHANDREIDFLERDKVRIVPTARPLPIGPTESDATIKVRRGQQFFRQSILNAYGVRCCITGINVPRLLVASHIKPWSEYPDHRLDAGNGLCLSALHDAAFDAGLITLDDGYRVVLSKHLTSHFPQPALEQSFVQYAGRPIRLPDKFAEPRREFLAYHREAIFGG